MFVTIQGDIMEIGSLTSNQVNLKEKYPNLTQSDVELFSLIYKTLDPSIDKIYRLKFYLDAHLDKLNNERAVNFNMRMEYQDLKKEFDNKLKEALNLQSIMIKSTEEDSWNQRAEFSRKFKDQEMIIANLKFEIADLMVNKENYKTKGLEEVDKLNISVNKIVNKLT